MTVQVAIHHRTTYRYDRSIVVGSQTIRLRPAPHCRTAIKSYSLNVSPAEHFLHWQQDPHGNFQARAVVPDKTQELTIDVDLAADLTVINPFDFFLDGEVESFPFTYSESTTTELSPFLEIVDSGPLLRQFIQSIDRNPRQTIDFLVGLNQSLHDSIDYQVRHEPGVQSCEETLAKQQGSCRDTAFLLIQVLRHLGLAARFSSGYLIQLKSDEQPTVGMTDSEEDTVDLHAWAEVYLPGAGWIGLDPTSGLLAGEGHIPLACTPTPDAAAPISGSHEPCDTTFEASLTVKRLQETPQPTHPYAERDLQLVMSLGNEIDRRLDELDVRLTMGGEPTFVSIDDMESSQWRTEAIGKDKSRLADQLTRRLRARFSRGGLLHFGQGKQYPGEAMPRWAMRCFWRRDEQRIWNNDHWLADLDSEDQFDSEHAQLFVGALAKRLGVELKNILSAHDQDQPNTPVGCVLPLQMRWWESLQWQSGSWATTSLTLEPGDSPIGFRLPLDTLQAIRDKKDECDFFPADPFEVKSKLPTYEQLCQRVASYSGRRLETVGVRSADRQSETQWGEPSLDPGTSSTIHAALCVEPRDGTLHVFLPPVDRLEYYLELIVAIEETATALRIPVILEGYPPPEDDRLLSFAVTPDPGVIEVNIHPASSWQELTEITTSVYADARRSRLGAEKFETDGTHTGTGGGNHIVLGGAAPEESPFLRRPDLLKSLIGYWHNHPALSYFFSGRFVGPTSQAPRLDEGCCDSLHELEIAFEQIQATASYPPWYIDRIMRRFLMDRTGNRHRSEFCIDKLYAADCVNGRLGLLELRAFEMPPHAHMSLVQQLLIRALIVRFWEEPYEEQLVHWGSTLHDRFMLPHFLWQDLCDILEETRRCGMDFDSRWFEPHCEFRFPKLGSICRQGVELEIRQAIEPWYVIGDDLDGTARYVDSSLERLQVLVRGMTNPRHVVCCNGRRVPLHPTGVEGEFVAGVRFRAWQPPSCTHPTIPVDAPVTFDLVDCWMNRSLGGCRYHVAHPAGMDSTVFPVNGSEAESRRAARFVTTAHTSGAMLPRRAETSTRFPLTLDLRKD